MRASCSAGEGPVKPVAGLERIGPSTARKGNPHVASVVCLVPAGDPNPPAAGGAVHTSRQRVRTWVQLQGTFHKRPSASWRFCGGEPRWETADAGKCEYSPSPKGGFGSVTTGMQDRERGKLGRGGLNWSSTRETSRVDYFKTTFVLADWIFIPKLTHKFERLKTILTPVPAVLRVKYGRMHLARPFDMPHLTEVTQIGQDLTNGNWVIFRFAGRPATPHFYLRPTAGTRRTKPTSHSLVSSRLALARSWVNSPWSLTLLFLLSHRCGIRSASDSHGLSSVRRRTPQVTTYFLLIACKLIVGTSTLGFATRPVTTSSSRRRPNTACKPPQHRAKIPLQHQCEFRPNASRKRRRQLGHYSDGGYDSDNYAPTTVRTTMGMAILQTRNGFKNPPKLCQPVS
ncbi:hypothetical protein H4582DRAFT_2059322 [Lactarius indigo]|nr:hypothetical protein H4582DRAFT_2059322 [Lactarius indigo]